MPAVAVVTGERCAREDPESSAEGGLDVQECSGTRRRAAVHRQKIDAGADRDVPLEVGDPVWPGPPMAVPDAGQQPLPAGRDRTSSCVLEEVSHLRPGRPVSAEAGCSEGPRCGRGVRANKSICS